MATPELDILAPEAIIAPPSSRVDITRMVEFTPYGTYEVENKVTLTPIGSDYEGIMSGSKPQYDAGFEPAILPTEADITLSQKPTRERRFSRKIKALVGIAAAGVFSFAAKAVPVAASGVGTEILRPDFNDAPPPPYGARFCKTGEVPDHKFDQTTFDQNGNPQNWYYCDDPTVPPIEGPPPIMPGQIVNLDVVPGMVMFGNMTSIGEGAPIPYGAGYGAVYSVEAGYNHTSVTNVTGFGDVSANGFFADTGSTGKLGIVTGTSAQHQVVDAELFIPKDDNTEIYPSPVRSVDTRQSGVPYKAGDVLKVSYGLEKAGKSALINLTVDGSNGPAWYAAYPCNEGYQGTSTVNTDGIGATPSADVVHVDSAGYICVMGDADARGLIVDTYGFASWKVTAPERVVDTRKTGGKLTAAGQEYVVHTNVPNALFFGRLTVDNASAPGWLAAYPTAVGYKGGSLVNPDGKSATSGLMIVMTDGNGDYSIKSSGITADIIVDKSGVIPLADLGITTIQPSSPQRLVDTRTFQQ